MSVGGRHNGMIRDPAEGRGTWWSGMLKLLYPGMGIKRWLLVGAMGIAVTSIGVAFMLRKLLALRFPDFLPSYLEGVVLLVGGGIVILLAIYGLYRSIGPLILASSSIDGLADTIYTRRSRGRGPRIVAIGGGTGLSVLLRGLKAYTDNLTAIITVADDGGSSGRLRRELGVLPPGDFRNCLVAMSESEPLLAELFQYRFDQGDGLKGHSFGNLFIVAMTNVTESFQQALLESSKVLAVQGQIMPATLENVNLSARLKNGRTVRGESRLVEHGGQIEDISIEPSNPEAYPPAVEAVQLADLIVIGPGSLFTSILPNLLVPDLAQALNETTALKVYVCNVVTQVGETDGYSVEDHVKLLQSYTFHGIADYVVANGNPPDVGPEFMGEPVKSDGSALAHAILTQTDLVDPSHAVRHDPEKLAKAITAIYQRSRRSSGARTKLAGRG
ncbi:MAG: uridine diphosphate-N-acetylglucosamine-binding protein YvcK [Chloroflexi bacterium]|nr:uridine diphosphate-N-acetylglucosamine-binding protein YvcK [Chloroflexota bacterium]